MTKEQLQVGNVIVITILGECRGAVKRVDRMSMSRSPGLPVPKALGETVGSVVEWHAGDQTNEIEDVLETRDVTM